jgi:predicted CoA-binding protein
MPRPDDALIREILTRTRKIALVGASPKPERPSHQVGEFLTLKGYTVIPVNPGQAGQTLFGETVRASLKDCPEDVDMVDIFRRSDEVMPVVEEALAELPNLKTIWMQIGVIDEEAAALARARGVDVVMNLCPKIEYPRLMR